MSRFGDWARKARACCGAATVVDLTAPKLREAADELERLDLGPDAVRALRMAAELLTASRKQLEAVMQAATLRAETREAVYWEVPR